MNYRLWVSEDRCTMIHMWDDGTVTVATRPDPSATWGPPIRMVEES